MRRAIQGRGCRSCRGTTRAGYPTSETTDLILFRCSAFAIPILSNGTAIVVVPSRPRPPKYRGTFLQLSPSTPCDSIRPELFLQHLLRRKLVQSSEHVDVKTLTAEEAKKEESGGMSRSESESHLAHSHHASPCPSSPRANPPPFFGPIARPVPSSALPAWRE